MGLPGEERAGPPMGRGGQRKAGAARARKEVAPKEEALGAGAEATLASGGAGRIEASTSTRSYLG